MLKKILLVVVAVVVVLVAVVAMRPAQYRVERSVVIAAAPNIIYPLVANYAGWTEWSPWEKLDPAMQREMTGTPGTPGAKYAWQGNDQVGKGSMTILEAKEPLLVRSKLEFIEPWTSTATTSFVLAPEAGGTKVTWDMEGHNDFMGKAFSLVMDMDAMIGKDYEAGLATLKKLAEAKAEAAAIAAAQEAPTEAPLEAEPAQPGPPSGH